ncbi:MAG: TnpV protein [Oscillospiraceae bacterium]|nr:TnpV protein [Oscillospiraceae bacterium]
MSETLTYTARGDYLLPDIRLSEPPREEAQPLGRYARMRKAFLKEHRKITYSKLLLSEKLYPHLRETDEAASRRFDRIMTALTAQTDLPGKAADPMKWTAAMNTLKAQAEEMIQSELIYA